jgi:uncharacterized membrane protein
MAGTNLAFGYLTVRGLRKLGLPLSGAEAEAYLGWFSVLGTWLGVEPELSPYTLADTYALATAIEDRHHQPSYAGQQLTHSLLTAFSEAEGAPSWLVDRAPKLMAALVGPSIAQTLNLPETPESELNNLVLINTVRSLTPLNIDFLNLRRAQREVRRANFTVG